MLFQKQHTMKLLLLLPVVIHFKDIKAPRPRNSSFTSNETDNVSNQDAHYSCIHKYLSATLLLTYWSTLLVMPKFT